MPILSNLCGLLSSHSDDLDNLDDSTLYRCVVYAARLRYSGSAGDSCDSQTQVSNDGRESVLARLQTGWFERAPLKCPQAWYSTTGNANPAIVVASTVPRTELEAKPRGAVWTATYLPDGTSAWEFLEHAEFSARRRSRYSISFSTQHSTVFTINDREDYLHLVTQYPVRSKLHNRVTVNWRQAAHEFDAVHLTTHGLVTTQDVPIETPYGGTVLRGWDSECTAWLRTPPRWSVRRDPKHAAAR